MLRKGKLKISGNLGKAMSLEKMMTKMQKRSYSTSPRICKQLKDVWIRSETDGIQFILKGQIRNQVMPQSLCTF